MAAKELLFEGGTREEPRDIEAEAMEVLGKLIGGRIPVRIQTGTDQRGFPTTIREYSVSGQIVREIKTRVDADIYDIRIEYPSELQARLDIPSNK